MERKGFLAKLFTAFEQELIINTSNQEEMVWMLWSIKESTYKAYQRIHYNRGFYPVKIEIQSVKRIGKQYYSTIFLFGSLFYGKTSIKNDVIYTIVVQNKNYFKIIQTIKDTFISKDKNGLPFVVYQISLFR
ncbi:MAG: 4-phosphopantetheinyl transferase family protein [Flavobacterium sp.]|nr:4-phosphopantetheinyl transferase family protein [Flavobacterium sp.]